MAPLRERESTISGMGYEQILYKVDDAIAWVTLNRPARLNAWTHVMECEVRSAMQKAAADEGVRVIVLTGAGRGFCSGADMDHLQQIQGGNREARSDEPFDPNAAE